MWRGARGRQASLARLLQAVDVRAVDEAVGRSAGVLLGRAGLRDAVDATVIAICQAGDRVLTSHPLDLQRLADVSTQPIRVVQVR